MLLRSFLILSTIVTGVLTPFSHKAIAADNVIVKYGLLQESISVEELKTFSETGETSPKLDFYLKQVKIS